MDQGSDGPQQNIQKRLQMGCEEGDNTGSAP